MVWYDPLHDDPEMQLVTRFGRRKENALAPIGPDEDDSLDRVLAFQTLNDFGNANRLIQRSGKI